MLLIALVSAVSWSVAHAETAVLYATASLTSALEELLPGKRFPNVVLSFASSSSLARQIEAGAPADLYFSANRKWMDYLQEEELIEVDTRADLLSNNLVVIAPKDEVFGAVPQKSFAFATAFSGRLALGDPDHVPVGLYARQALAQLGWWQALEDRLAPAPDARAALVFVARGECAAGIVYATDAAVSDKVEVVATLPDSLHDPIRYPLAAVKGRATPKVRRLLAFLHSDEAAAVFRRHGFIALSTEGDRARP